MVNNKLSLIIIVAVVASLVLGGDAAAVSPIVAARLYVSVDKLRPGDSFKVAVEARVKKGFHVNANPAEAPLSLTLKAPRCITFREPVFPASMRESLKSDPRNKISVYKGRFVVVADGRVAENAKLGPITITADLETQSCADEQCMLPEISVSSAKTTISNLGTQVRQINDEAFACPAGRDDARKMCDRLAGMGTGPRLLLLYAMGLLLAFTPCVYPMVPVTVGYFSAQSEARRSKRVLLLAAAYVAGLALTYSLLGAVAALTGGVFGAAMQKPAVLIGIAVLLVGLALSMFGLYELRPPAFVQNRASGRSGLAGALMMGLVFGIVAAPCVGPAVLGLMAYVASVGSPALGFLMFFALSLGIGTPLFFLAAFSANMPVPGMWMVAVKKVAGFLLIGAAAYFIQPLLPESVGRYLMPVVIAAAGLYLGFIERSIRSSRLAASAGKVFGAAALVFAVLQFAPHAQKPSIEWQPYSPAAVVKAIEAGRPVMIDFSASWCTACRELEHGAFSDPKVLDASKAFARFRVDGSNRKNTVVVAAEKRFDVSGYPAVIFVAGGAEVRSARIVSDIEPAEMLKRMDLVR